VPTGVCGFPWLAPNLRHSAEQRLRTDHGEEDCEHLVKARWREARAPTHLLRVRKGVSPQQHRSCAMILSAGSDAVERPTSLSIATALAVWKRAYPGESGEHFQKRISRRFSDQPEAYHLFVPQWQIFGHLTFGNARRRDTVKSKFFTFLRRVVASSNRSCAAGEKKHMKNVRWCCRSEWGTRMDLSEHLHFVIGNLPQGISTPSFCQQMRRLWRDVGGGVCKIEPYICTPDLGEGCAYLAKRPSVFADWQDESVLTLSKSLLAHLRKKVSRETGL
jgi:hypothetical protein